MKDRYQDSPILVLGAGGWGTALAMVLSESGHPVRVWGRNPEYMDHLETQRENPRFLPGVRLPAGIRFSAEISALSDGVKVVLSVVPTQFLRSVLKRLHSHLGSAEIFVSCSKGLEVVTHRRPTEILAEFWPEAATVVLSGPSHAEEVSRSLPTTVVAASTRAEPATLVQGLLRGQNFRVYTGTDPVGAEIGGVSKNIMALAAGISDGLGFGDNTRAGLMTRGLREMTRLGVALGARPETFAGLSGVGDLIATCTSEHSRNRSVGFRLGHGELLQDIVRSTEKVAEGVESTRALLELASTLKVDVPITREVHAVLFEGKKARKAVESLMSRELREEIA